MGKTDVVPGRVGVLLVNTGTPAEPTPRAVKRYLGKFLMDKRIAPMNRVAWWFVLHLFILPRRSKVSADKYREIWTPEGSPFQRTHEKLVRGLQAYYDEAGFDAVVALAMSYGEPSIAKSLKGLRNAGCESLVVLPMYPQSAFSTTGSVEDGVARAVRKVRWRGEVSVVDNYSDHPTYIRAIARSIENAGFDAESADRVLFSYHSIPLNDIDAGDTYELQTGSTSLLVASELGIDRKRWTIGYQCRFDKGREWLQPYTRDVLQRLATKGEGRVFFVCPNFAVDCLETLYEVHRELKVSFYEFAREAQVQRASDSFVYVPCLNSSKAHLKVLVDVLCPYVEKE